MGLDDEQRNCIQMLETGHAVVSLDGRFFEPVHVGFPGLDIRKGQANTPHFRDKEKYA